MIKPFVLSPAGKDYLWGGKRLKEEFHKAIDLSPLAETWECSTHPDGPSFVNSGPERGKSLVEVLKAHPSYLGKKHQREDGQIPILVKFIDAAKDLSVQVHPSDEYADRFENHQLGKTEMWYVLSATPEAKLVYGFSKNMTKESLSKALEEGTILEDCNLVPVQAGDSFLITSGTVHAICAGCLIAEIQESSNLTYRLYDYHRLGKDGKPRELHIAKALAVADLKKRELPKKNDYPLTKHEGYQERMLATCSYFTTKELDCFGKVPVCFHGNEDSFLVLLCIEGNGSINMEDGDVLPLAKGECLFVPAGCSGFTLSGSCRLLKIECL